MGNEAKGWELRQKKGSFPLICEETQEAVLWGTLGSHKPWEGCVVRKAMFKCHHVILSILFSLTSLLRSYRLESHQADGSKGLSGLLACC